MRRSKVIDLLKSGSLMDADTPKPDGFSIQSPPKRQPIFIGTHGGQGVPLLIYP